MVFTAFNSPLNPLTGIYRFDFLSISQKWNITGRLLFGRLSVVRRSFVRHHSPKTNYTTTTTPNNERRRTLCRAALPFFSRRHSIRRRHPPTRRQKPVRRSVPARRGDLTAKRVTLARRTAAACNVRLLELSRSALEMVSRLAKQTGRLCSGQTNFFGDLAAARFICSNLLCRKIFLGFCRVLSHHGCDCTGHHRARRCAAVGSCLTSNGPECEHQPRAGSRGVQ